MAVVLRLRRMGSNKKPFFRVVAADERTSTIGRFIENLGWYDPKKKHGNFELKMDRVQYWIDNGARQTTSVKTLVKKAGMQADTAPAPAADTPPPAPTPAPETAQEEPAAEPEPEAPEAPADEDTPAEEEKPAPAEA